MKEKEEEEKTNRALAALDIAWGDLSPKEREAHARLIQERLYGIVFEGRNDEDVLETTAENDPEGERASKKLMSRMRGYLRAGKDS